MENRKILIVTYYWPPSGGVGVQRWINYALQLKEQGWDPIVLTPENPQFAITDEDLLDKVAGIETHKVPIWEPFDLFHTLTRGKNKKEVQQGLVLEKKNPSIIDKAIVWVRGNLFIPDPRRFWVKPASKKALKLISEKDISLLVTTGPPHSMHLVGLQVKKNSSVKWIADFRDPWTKWDILKKLKVSSLAMRLHKNLERKVTSTADLSLTTTKGMAEALGIQSVLQNGVSFPDNSAHKPAAEKFTIGYFGLLNEMRNPNRLWMLLDQLCRENEDFNKQLEIRIAGIISDNLKSKFEEFSMLQDKVVFLAYIPHHQILEEYQKCNVLLLLQNKTDNAAWILPVKFFEYLAAKRMILALGQRKSDLADAMLAHDVGEIFSYDDVTDIRAFIEMVYEENKYPNLEDSKELIKAFSHQNLGIKLEKYLLEVLQETS